MTNVVIIVKSPVGTFRSSSSELKEKTPNDLSNFLAEGIREGDDITLHGDGGKLVIVPNNVARNSVVEIMILSE